MNMQPEHRFENSAHNHLLPASRGIMTTVDAPLGRVLVVDDDPQMRALLEDLLALDGLRVITASDGKAGLEAILRSQPDVVLLDVQLPFLDGSTFAAVLKRTRTSALLQSS
jgi:CheY-like chemotaxis protein